MGLPRERRLRQTRDFQRVQAAGRSWAHPLMIVRALPNTLPQTRFGIVCGRRVGNAVMRNRVKRRLREVARRTPLAPGWDVVAIARAGAASAPFEALAGAFAELIRRSRLAETPPET